MGVPDFVIQLFPLLLMQSVLLFAVVPLAIKSSLRFWIVFAVIPLIGGFAYPLLLGRGIAQLLDR